MDKNETSYLFSEYSFLKTEINNHSVRHNNLVTFTITSVVTIIGLAFTINNEYIVYLTLLPFVILVPMAARIARSRKSIALVAAYMIVFLEPKLDGINWETATLCFYRKAKNNKSTKDKIRDLIYVFRYYECFILSLVTAVIFYVRFYNARLCIQMSNTILLMIPILATLVILYMTHRTNNVGSDKEKLVKHWINLSEDIISYDPRSCEAE